MKKLTKGLCLSTAIVAAGALFSVNASAGNMFTVDETSIAGHDAFAGFIQADEILGAYQEVVEFGGANDFKVSIHMQLTDFAVNGNPLGGTDISPVFGDPDQYSLYSTFYGEGTYTQTTTPQAGGLPDIVDTNFIFTSGSYELFLDPDTNTTFTMPVGSAGAITLASNGLDYRLASGFVVDGGGDLTTDCNGDNCGSFGTDLSVELDPAGSLFFVEPVPFFDIALTSGDFTQFDVVPNSVVQGVNGKISVIFEKVPEPATLALFGLGLAGMAGVARRKTKQA